MTPLSVKMASKDEEDLKHSEAKVSNIWRRFFLKFRVSTCTIDYKGGCFNVVFFRRIEIIDGCPLRDFL